MHINYDEVASLYDAYVTTSFDVPFFIYEARRAVGQVIELTSGTGRLSIPLAEAGINLTCVDYSQGMLDVLITKLKDRKLRANVYRADVCHLDFSEQFELAIFPFQSFMEIVGEERQRAVLAGVFASLRPGGRFICTMHNPAVRRTQIDGALHVVGCFPLADGSLVVSGFEQGGQPVVSRLQFFEFFGPDGQLRWKRMLPMEFELIAPECFEAMAVQAGFHIVETFGNYERAPFSPSTSLVVIWVLRKPA